MIWNEKDSNWREAQFTVCFMASGLVICACNRSSLCKRQLKFLLLFPFFHFFRCLLLCFRHSADTNLFFGCSVGVYTTNSVIAKQQKRWKRKMTTKIIVGGVTLFFLQLNLWKRWQTSHFRWNQSVSHKTMHIAMLATAKNRANEMRSIEFGALQNSKRWLEIWTFQDTPKTIS